MDLKRYLELYLSESQDHLRALGHGLLALERGGDQQAAVEEAFRAAHTIKGMSATMGFRAVTDICHQLEDRLEDVRARRLLVSREVVDELLESCGCTRACAFKVPCRSRSMRRPTKP